MFETPNLKKMGALEVLQLNANASVDAAHPLIVMIHGYGADASDLVPLAQEVTAAEEWRWIFPNGPLEVPIGPGFWGRAWAPVDFEAFDRAMRSGQDFDFVRERTPEMDQARTLIAKMLESLKVPIENVVLAGFSQGAMLALDVALSLQKSPRGLLLLSGCLFDEAGIRARAPRHQGLRFLQSHGENDMVLPYKSADKLYHVLQECGLDGFLLNFRGGHEIPAKVLAEMDSFLRSLALVGKTSN